MDERLHNPQKAAHDDADNERLRHEALVGAVEDGEIVWFVSPRELMRRTREDADRRGETKHEASAPDDAATPY
jgi:hypothetical protein